MSYTVVFAPEADEGLDALFKFIANKGSPLVAEHYTAAILETCEGLSQFPHRGVPRNDIRPGLRVTHHKGRTIIAYAVNDDLRRVVILGVFYGGQDYPRVLDPDRQA